MSKLTDDLILVGSPNAPDPVTVRQYGLRPPLDWRQDCDDEMRRMTQLWNRLVEIERANRDAYRAATSNDTTVAMLEAEQAALQARREALVSERAEQRKFARAKVATPALDEAIRALTQPLRDVTARLKEARAEARARMKPQLAALEDRRRAAVKEVRQQSGLWWGNYNAVCAAYDRARQRALKTGGELRFRRFGGTGRIVNQIQGGMSADDLFAGAHSQVRVAPVDPAAWTMRRSKAVKRMMRTTLTATVYTRDGERRNVTWPMIMHRPLPDGAKIKEVVVTRRRIGPRDEWSVSFVLRAPATLGEPAGGVCGINLGWRRVPDGIRVATLADADGHVEHLVLPQTIMSAQRVAEELQSERDSEAEQIIASVRALDWQSAPETLRDYYRETVHGRAVRAGRIVSLMRVWRETAADWLPDELARLDEWQRMDRADWYTQAHTLRHVVGRRRKIYETWANSVVRRYGVIAMSRVDWSNIARLETPDGDDNEAAKTAWARRLASPSAIESALKLVADREGASIVRSETKVTMICAECGVENKPLDRSPLHHICTGCGAMWDQDDNAARNLARFVNCAGKCCSRQLYTGGPQQS